MSEPQQIIFKNIITEALDASYRFSVRLFADLVSKGNLE